MEERRTGEVRRRIMEVLEKTVDLKEELRVSGSKMVEVLHNKIGGQNFVEFCDMFRELHYLILSGKLNSTLLDLAMLIYSNVDEGNLDIREYRNRRRIETGA
ncbi:MAG: hypothetical protein A2V69_03120 [Candidatus Portnoybacteria bacterium RBG_13_40_8]|uniref:Uncharacterized protein n=1 Tax=Candidatus Portnoybacteria bacterium RBG_13_40_8 TaxID=1801990 RepID=A0A1G2F483_9BACT|nr:MAG: hypothetical protein A2V69_03120 [Candidatus Portnoybacteria bacterium RBG_13_40_8]OGZ35210.1 MAG: hypothetical protein A2V60_00090 [Candidatus Portnoybacteria bacterium RIFCSPHIGHO2_01_FULL_39_19]